MKPDRMQSSLFVGVLVVGALGVTQFLIRPSYRKLAEKKARVQETKRDIARGTQFTSGLDQLELYLAEFQAALDELDRLVPADDNQSARMREVFDIASPLGIKASGAQPEPPIPLGDLVALPIRFELVGPYEAIEKFLFDVEALPRHSRVTRCTIEPAKDVATGTEVRAEIELTQYSLGTTSRSESP